MRLLTPRPSAPATQPLAEHPEVPPVEVVVDPFETLQRAGFSLFDTLTFNVMVADSTMVIRYVNQASLQTLRKLEHLLPIRANEIVGSSIDIFHRHPHVQRTLLADPGRLPHRAVISLGSERLDLNISALYADGAIAAYLVTWSVVTHTERLKAEMQELAGTVAATVAELEASIAEIANHAARSATISSQAADDAMRAGSSMSDLAERTTSIRTVVDFIANVAAQTNLLALNATIESARAGEAGRGFAVVANEVKQLAGATRDSTADIRTAVESIFAGVTDAHSAIAATTDVIASVQEMASSIAAAVEEQTAVIAEISRTATAAVDAINRHDSMAVG